MIENTFQILPSVGAGRERSIWASDILTWNDFIECETVKGISRTSKPLCDGTIAEAYASFEDGDADALGKMIPKREHWRMYERFSKETAFFDIETDGLSRDSTVTVVTVMKNERVTTLIEGKDLNAETLYEAFDDPAMIVSFNGSCFDVPVLRYNFPSLDLDIPHFDLRFGCRRAGYTGGLKNVERMLGMERDEEIANVDGMDAVRLWKQWIRANDKRSLDTLVEYNLADTMNLRNIADVIYSELVRGHVGSYS